MPSLGLSPRLAWPQHGTAQLGALTLHAASLGLGKKDHKKQLILGCSKHWDF